MRKITSDKMIERLFWLAASFPAILVALLLLAIGTVSANAQNSENNATISCSGKNLAKELSQSHPDLYGQARAQADKTLNGKGIFWKIEKEGVPPSWLLGTMHQADKRIARLEGARRAAFDQADTLVLETTEVLDPAKAAGAIMANMHLLRIQDDETIETLLGEEHAGKLDKLLKQRGISLLAFNKMRPWFVATAISLPLCEQQLKQAGKPVLDVMLGKMALEEEKAVKGLETVKEQLEAMAGLSRDFHVSSLKETLDIEHLLTDVNETMKLLYLEGETGLIMPVLKSVASSKEQAETDFTDFQKRLIENRNNNMAERSADLLKKGNVFIAVGALHLPGETGLVEAFKRQGYTLTRAD